MFYAKIFVDLKMWSHKLKEISNFWKCFVLITYQSTWRKKIPKIV